MWVDRDLLPIISFVPQAMAEARPWISLRSRDIIAKLSITVRTRYKVQISPSYVWLCMSDVSHAHACYFPCDEIMFRTPCPSILQPRIFSLLCLLAG